MSVPTDESPTEWMRLSDEVDGVPLWKHRGESCYVATRDMDQLLFIGAALARFDYMNGKEFCQFVAVSTR